MRLFAVVLVTCVLVVACGPTSKPPPAQSQGPRPPPPAGACGVQIFRTPACQQALDSMCCPFERECAKDPECVRVNYCVMDCKTRLRGQAADSCANGCAIRSRDAYCRGACRGQGGDCQTICLQRGGPAEPMVKWGLIADCSKKVHYPDGVTCDDDT